MADLIRCKVCGKMFRPYYYPGCVIAGGEELTSDDTCFDCLTQIGASIHSVDSENEDEGEDGCTIN